MAASYNNQQKWLIAVGDEGQTIEDALQQMYTGYWIDEAVGEQLNVLGRTVGQLRGGMDDDDYRRMIRARISVNRSKGTIADILTVAQLVVDDEDVYYQIDNQGAATVVLRLLDTPVADDLVETLLLPMLRSTVAAGVRIIVEWSSSAVANWLILDTDQLDVKQFIDAED